MEVKIYDGQTPMISDIKAELDERGVLLKFKWPHTLECLYVYKINLQEEQTLDYEKPNLIYTKNEYMRFGGLLDQGGDSGLMEYILCPYMQDESDHYLVTFKENCNRIKVITSKIHIQYEIEEKKKLFKPRKVVKMHIYCDEEVPSNYLYYVKKRGSVPTSLTDGMQFQFITDFEAGENSLPEIEIDKEEYIAIYLSDEVPYRELYQVVRLE